MYVIKRQQRDNAEWLVSVTPESWGERDHAMRFETRRLAHRAAITINLSGDWSVDPGALPLLRE
jgi:hypothetical protein